MVIECLTSQVHQSTVANTASSLGTIRTPIISQGGREGSFHAQKLLTFRALGMAMAKKLIDMADEDWTIGFGFVGGWLPKNTRKYDRSMTRLIEDSSIIAHVSLLRPIEHPI